MKRLLLAAVLALSSCASPGGVASGLAEALLLPEREIVTGLARLDDTPQKSGAWLAFTSAPGSRTIVLRSEDGRKWERLSILDRAGIVYGVRFVDADRGFVLHGATSGAVLFATVDGGRSWSESMRMPGRYVRLAAEGEHLWILGSNGEGRASALRTADGKEAREIAQFEGLAPALFADTARLGDRRFFAGGSGGLGVLYVSEREGALRRVDVGEIPNLVSIAFDDAGHGLAVGARGEVLRTLDGGASWAPALSGTDRDLAGVAFVKPGRAYVCGRDGMALRTADSGAHFERVELSRREDLFGLARVAGSPGVFALGGRGWIPFFGGE